MWQEKTLKQKQKNLNSLFSKIILRTDIGSYSNLIIFQGISLS